MRCYSMSSSPALGEEMQVTVKRVPGGVVSNWIIDHCASRRPGRAGPADRVLPARPGDSGDLVAFAAGSGITPVFSLVKTALATTERTVRLLYANRDRASVIFGTELDELEGRHRGGSRWSAPHDVEHGLLTPDTVTTFVGEAAGTGRVLRLRSGALHGDRGAGPAWPRGGGRPHPHRALHPGRPPRRCAAPPPEPAGGTRVTDRARRSQPMTTDHRPGTTILQTARQMGMSPPFSCESGSCATCMARLVEGSVSMFVNNALTDDEVDEGWILTCQSVPTTPSVRVVYGYEER